ncbi:hypothetical protein ACNPM4_00450 [Microbacterium sp. AGC62]
MSTPRYTPRNFVLPPRDFGRRWISEWRAPDPSWTPKEIAQLEAAQIQHRIAYGILEIYLPTTNARTITGLASQLGMSYDRLQRMLNGQVVMQLEDIGLLRSLDGVDIDSLITNRGELPRHDVQSA